MTVQVTATASLSHIPTLKSENIVDIVNY
jgi:hypothetical protein